MSTLALTLIIGAVAALLIALLMSIPRAIAARGDDHAAPPGESDGDDACRCDLCCDDSCSCGRPCDGCDAAD